MTEICLAAYLLVHLRDEGNTVITFFDDSHSLSRKSVFFFFNLLCVFGQLDQFICLTNFVLIRTCTNKAYGPIQFTSLQAF